MDTCVFSSMSIAAIKAAGKVSWFHALTIFRKLDTAAVNNMAGNLMATVSRCSTTVATLNAVANFHRTLRHRAFRRQVL